MVCFKIFTFSKRCKIFFIFWLIFSTNTFSVEKDSIDYYLSKLDEQLLNKDEYEQMKRKKIQALKGKLALVLDSETKYEVYGALFNEYQSYNYDSAFVYANRMMELALQLDDIIKLTDARLMAAYSCTSAGLFLEAKELLHAIDSTSLDTAHKLGLYSSYSKLLFP